MIRFSALLVAIATVLLVAGVVTSKLALVYVAIGISAVALLTLAAGAGLKRNELFGQPAVAGHAVAGHRGTAQSAPAQSESVSVAAASHSAAAPWEAEAPREAEAPPARTAVPDPASAAWSATAKPSGERWTGLPAEGRFDTGLTAYSPPSASPARPAEQSRSAELFGPAEKSRPAEQSRLADLFSPGEHSRPVDPFSPVEHVGGDGPADRDAADEASVAAPDEPIVSPVADKVAEASTDTTGESAPADSSAPADDVVVDDPALGDVASDDPALDDAASGNVALDDVVAESGHAASDGSPANDSPVADSPVADNTEVSSTQTLVNDTTSITDATVATDTAGEASAEDGTADAQARAGSSTTANAGAVTTAITAADTSTTEDAAPEPAPKADPTREVTVVPGVPRYHDARCILIRFMGEDDLEKTTLAEAQQLGCTPCRACLPDQETE